MIVSPVVRVMDDALELLSQTRLRINGGSDNIFAGGNVSRQGALRPVICVLFSSPQNAYCAPVLRSKGVTEFGHLRILENMLSEATKLRALCFLKLFLLVLMVGSENSRGHV